jgi:hypothetical protein
VPSDCSDAAFSCHPWALVTEEGALTEADELEEFYAGCSQGQVRIPIDNEGDDASEEPAVSERLACASPTTGFDVDWTSVASST